MKWQHNPDSIDFGTYAYKKKNTDAPILIEVSINKGIPAHTRGWWLGPLIVPIETINGVNPIPCICVNCLCWKRKGKSQHGTCRRNPPVDNNWSTTLNTDYCYEFIPKQLQEK